MAGRFSVIATSIHCLIVSLCLSFPLAYGVAGTQGDKEVGQDKVRKIFVDCSRGRTLGQALRAAREGDTIVVTGTCSEKVTITVDRLTLDGRGSAIIDGNANAAECNLTEAVEGLVEVDGAQGVVLTGLTVQNSPVDGIFLRNGAAAIIRDTTAQHNCDDGIHLAQSVATFENATFQENRENGMNVFNTSAVSLSSDRVTAFNNNGLFGVQNQHSVVAVHGGATLQAHNNRFMGVAVFAAGRIIAFTGSHISINDNAANGVLLLDGGVSAAYATIEIAGNGKRLTNQDSNGMTLVDGSVFSQTGGSLQVKDNQLVGVVAENSTVSLRLMDANAVNIQGLALRFGARATLIGQVAPILCDETVLIQGQGQQCSPGAAVQGQR